MSPEESNRLHAAGEALGRAIREAIERDKAAPVELPNDAKLTFLYAIDRYGPMSHDELAAHWAGGPRQSYYSLNWPEAAVYIVQCTAQGLITLGSQDATGLCKFHLTPKGLAVIQDDTAREFGMGCEDE